MPGGEQLREGGQTDLGLHPGFISMSRVTLDQCLSLPVTQFPFL